MMKTTRLAKREIDPVEGPRCIDTHFLEKHPTQVHKTHKPVVVLYATAYNHHRLLPALESIEDEASVEGPTHSCLCKKGFWPSTSSLKKKGM